MKAVSITFPVFTKPVSASVESAASHDLSAFGAELRTTVASAPVFETLIRTPSRTPANFFPPRVSELVPNTERVPSAWRTIALSAVFVVPIDIALPKTPCELAL